jgi:hypothetical protein
MMHIKLFVRERSLLCETHQSRLPSHVHTMHMNLLCRDLKVSRAPQRKGNFLMEKMSQHARLFLTLLSSPLLT